jgi:hypothetical protein
MGFDPCNCFLKIQEAVGTPTLKVGIHFRVWRFNSHTLPYSQSPKSMKCDSRGSLLARTFVSPSLSREHKARVATFLVICNCPSGPPHNNDSFSLIVLYLLEDEDSK